MWSVAYNVTTPMMRLQDPGQTKVLIVTLAETTPVLEAAHLQADLRRAGIEPWAWVINQSLAATVTTSGLLQQRAQNERAQVDDVANRHAKLFAVVGLQTDEPVGAHHLRALVDAPAGVYGKTGQRTRSFPSRCRCDCNVRL